jgi:hypothetical protein
MNQIKEHKQLNEPVQHSRSSYFNIITRFIFLDLLGQRLPHGKRYEDGTEQKMA